MVRCLLEGLNSAMLNESIIRDKSSDLDHEGPSGGSIRLFCRSFEATSTEVGVRFDGA